MRVLPLAKVIVWLRMAHESRLDRELRDLLQAQRVAALGTLNENGRPMVSMAPYALEPAQACMVIHVSGLAAHTRNLQTNPDVSLLVMRPEAQGEPVHALPRVTLEGRAQVLVPQSGAWDTGRAAYLARFPEAEPMTELGDFRFVAIRITGARQVAGFGAARSVDAQVLAQVMRSAIT